MREMLAQENSLDAVQLVMPPDGYRAQLVALRSGDVLLFNGNVIHGSGPNHSTVRLRRAFICHYVPRGTVELSRWYSTP